MATVRRSPQAETDLETILEDLQQRTPAVAERYANEFYDKGKALAQFPEIGRSRPEIAPHLRSTLVKPYVIFYRIHDDEVQILRILHGRQDLRSIMRDETDE
jgi:toxin ParE1/3/4